MSRELEIKKNYATATTSCKHKNGVFVDVKLWLFNKTVFHCLDCSEQMSREELEQQEETD